MRMKPYGTLLREVAEVIGRVPLGVTITPMLLAWTSQMVESIRWLTGRVVAANLSVVKKNKVIVKTMKKVVKFHDSQIIRANQDYEQFACLYSKSISNEIFCDDDQHLDKYVKIQYGSNKIYRKCAAFRTVSAKEISLGNRSIRELGLKGNDLGIKRVEVRKSNWFAYQLYNSDMSQRIAFIIALAGLVCAFFSTCKDIVELIR